MFLVGVKDSRGGGQGNLNNVQIGAEFLSVLLPLGTLRFRDLKMYECMDLGI